MVVVAVIAILTTMVMPRFGSLMVRAKEAVVMGNLGGLRSAVSIYYAQNEGQYPRSLTGIIAIFGRFPIVTIPKADGKGAYHENVGLTWTGGPTFICDASSGDIWFIYDSGPSAGLVFVNCTHMDSRGKVWSSY